MDRNSLICRVAKTVMESKDTDVSMNIYDWDWVCGVGIYGVARAWKKTGDVQYREFVSEWTKKMISHAYDQKTINSTCPLLAVLELCTEEKQNNYWKVCTDIANWLLFDATKSVDGAYEHTCVQNGGIVFHDQAWADTLFMACIFLARMGKETGIQKYSNAAAEQLVLHHQLLKDKRTGLYYHGWDGAAKNHMSGALWGRANAWIVASTVEILECLPKEFDGRSFVLKSLTEQLDALIQYQRPNGMFGTVIDRPESYDETSAPAGISYGIFRGVHSGLLSEKYYPMAEKAAHAVIKRIRADGIVEEVSIGTPVMPTIEEYYEYIWKAPTLYGQALALLMLCEME